MTKRIVLHCLLVLLIISVITPFWTMSMPTPQEGEIVRNLEDINTEKLNKMSSEEFVQYMDNKAGKISGMERLIYPFKNLQFWFFYGQAFLAMFVPLLFATLLTSYMNERYKKNKIGA